MSDYPIQLDKLTKLYENNKAVNNLSLHMEQGEIFGLLGPNGAGKTTIISILSQLERPSSGKAFLFGKDVTKGDQATKLKLGLVPQEIVSQGFFTVEQILGFISGYYGIRNNGERIDYLIEKLGLQEHRKKKIPQLSGGMKRRFLIAKALVHSPKLLLLDEPTAGVDIELRETLWDFVRDLNKKEGMSILLTTHYLEEAEELCERVGIIDQGILKKVGPTKDLIQELTLREVIIGMKPGTRLIENQYLSKHDDDTWTFKIPYGKSFGELVGEVGIDLSSVVDVQIKEGDLEDAFLNIVGTNNESK